nr:MAG TPA: hypothetical protein [Caudoviricetes sp.]DAZ42463.1 MAG TPA: hypothetical protein [Caudoviricetes sp.]
MTPPRLATSVCVIFALFRALTSWTFCISTPSVKYSSRSL